MENKIVEETSVLPIIFYITGSILLILGLIIGYTIAEPEISWLGTHNWQITGIVWASTLTSSLLFFGFGKIIEMLIKIYNIGFSLRVK
jgi:uncharacterized membrane protein